MYRFKADKQGFKAAMERLTDDDVRIMLTESEKDAVVLFPLRDYDAATCLTAPKKKVAWPESTAGVLDIVHHVEETSLPAVIKRGRQQAAVMISLEDYKRVRVWETREVEERSGAVKKQSHDRPRTRRSTRAVPAVHTA